jgi:hypothetical protein
MSVTYDYQAPHFCSDCGEETDLDTCASCVHDVAPLRQWCADAAQIVYGPRVEIVAEEYGYADSGDLIRLVVITDGTPQEYHRGATLADAYRNCAEELRGQLADLRDEASAMLAKAVA